MKKLVLALCLVVSVNATAANMSLQCKTWEGEVQVDIKGSVSKELSSRVLAKDLEKALTDKKAVTVIESKVKNVLTDDFATSAKSFYVDFQNAPGDDESIELVLSATQEEPAEDDDMDNGKGVRLTLPDVIGRAIVVDPNVPSGEEYKETEYASLRTGLFLAELMGYDHGEDSTGYSDVICKLDIEKIRKLKPPVSPRPKIRVRQ